MSCLMLTTVLWSRRPGRYDSLPKMPALKASEMRVHVKNQDQSRSQTTQTIGRVESPLGRPTVDNSLREFFKFEEVYKTFVENIFPNLDQQKYAFRGKVGQHLRQVQSFLKTPATFKPNEWRVEAHKNIKEFEAHLKRFLADLAQNFNRSMPNNIEKMIGNHICELLQNSVNVLEISHSSQPPYGGAAVYLAAQRLPHHR